MFSVQLASTYSSMRDQAKMFKEQSKQMKRDHKEEMQALRSQLEQSQTALRIEREGGNDIGKKYEKQIQQLLQVKRCKLNKTQHEPCIGDAWMDAIYVEVYTECVIHFCI